MKLVDTNVLLHVVHVGGPRHDSARRWLDAALAGREALGLPWVALLGFIRISTSPRVYSRPLDPSQAAVIVERWLSNPVVVTPEPTARHLSLLHGLRTGPGAGTAGRRTNDDGCASRRPHAGLRSNARDLRPRRCALGHPHRGADMRAERAVTGGDGRGRTGMQEGRGHG